MAIQYSISVVPLTHSVIMPDGVTKFMGIQFQLVGNSTQAHHVLDQCNVLEYYIIGYFSCVL